MKTKELSPRRKAQNAAFQALPIALILNPLRFMRGGKAGRKGGRTRAPGWAVELATEFAKNGDGASVQRMARQYLS